MKVNVNDIVRFLNDVGGGRVTRIEGGTVYVEDDDGFERPTSSSELVVVSAAKSGAGAYERPLDIKTRLVEPDKPAPKPKPEAPVVVEETPEGDRLNILLAFEPKAIKHLNTTTFYTVLVNDSNYFLYYTYMTRRSEDREWKVRSHGLVEPNYLLTLEEIGYDDLNDVEHFAVQYVAFKQGKGFEMKNPALVQQHVDTSKFYKLHCFHENAYFDTPVLAFELVHNDLPAKRLVIDSSALEQAMKEKRRADKPRREQAKQPKPKSEIIVQDLHIAELLDNFAGLSNSDMLNYQLDKFREVMNSNINKIGQKIVFIHGKGEGVLRRALLDELKRKYPQCTVQDASFQEYGFGATQVTIHQRK